MNTRQAFWATYAGLAVTSVGCVEMWGINKDPELATGGTGGTSTSSTSTGSGGGGTGGTVGNIPCLMPIECGASTACKTFTCISGTCGSTNAPAGTIVGSPGGCRKSECDGAGDITTTVDDTDLPVDGNQCTSDTCIAGAASNPPLAAGASCDQNGGARCDGNGACVACLMPIDCGMSTACKTFTCTGGSCSSTNAPAGTPATNPTVGDCHTDQCDDNGNSVAGVTDDADKPADQDACHASICVGGVPAQAPKSGTCSFSGGKVCGDPASVVAGQCVGCNTVTDCTAGNLCLANRCSGLVLLAANEVATFGAAYQPGGTWSAPTAIGGASSDDLALAFTTTGTAVGAYRIPNGFAGGPRISEQVWYTTLTMGVWAPGKAIDPDAWAHGGPSLSAASSTAQLVYHGTNDRYYFTSYDVTSDTWASLQQVDTPSIISQGAQPAAIAARGSDAMVVFFDQDNNNRITAQDRVAGTWQNKVEMSSSKASSSYLPSVVALIESTDKLMAVYADDLPIVFQTRASGGAWSAPAEVGNATTSTLGRPALAALPGGGAIMAFRGIDENLYYAKYKGGSWSSVEPYQPNGTKVAVVWMPFVARGLPGATAEIAFIKKADNFVYHARLIDDMWVEETKVGTETAERVAIATFP